jgi:hypothetical protein
MPIHMDACKGYRPCGVVVKASGLGQASGPPWLEAYYP